MKNPSFDARTLDPRLFDLNNPHWYLHVPRGAASYVYKQRAKTERRVSLASVVSSVAKAVDARRRISYKLGLRRRSLLMF